jgi:hypothetical protein
MEQLTHLPAEQAIQRYIFRPLGLHQSRVLPRSSSAIPDPHARGYMYGTDFTGHGPTLRVGSHRVAIIVTVVSDLSDDEAMPGYVRKVLTALARRVP